MSFSIYNLAVQTTRWRKHPEGISSPHQSGEDALKYFRLAITFMCSFSLSMTLSMCECPYGQSYRCSHLLQGWSFFVAKPSFVLKVERRPTASILSTREKTREDLRVERLLTHGNSCRRPSHSSQSTQTYRNTHPLSTQFPYALAALRAETALLRHCTTTNVYMFALF